MSGAVQQPESDVVAESELLYSTTVEAKQIDQLGHMNVRYYGIHALAGARELVARLGLPDEDECTRAAFADLYTRHYREQLEGSHLEVWGGVLHVGKSDIRMYLELRNPALEEIGATFVFMVQLQDEKTRSPLSLNESVVDAANRARIAWPEHGQPRSVRLDTTPRALTLSEVRSMNLDGRPARLINQQDCDSNGVYRVDMFQDLVWGSEGISENDDWLRTLENGDRMGWATMESRCSLHELPRAGTRVQSFYTIVEVGRKTQHERFWVYDIDREILLCTASFVDVAFNINTRQAIEVPDFERARIDGNFHPELA